MAKRPADAFKEKTQKETKQAEEVKTSPTRAPTVAYNKRSAVEKIKFLHSVLPVTTSHSHVLFGLAGEAFTVGDLHELVKQL